MDRFSSSGNVLVNDELVSKITQTHLGVDPTMLVGSSGSKSEIDEYPLKITNHQQIPRRQFEIEGKHLLLLHKMKKRQNI